MYWRFWQICIHWMIDVSFQSFFLWFDALRFDRSSRWACVELYLIGGASPLFKKSTIECPSPVCYSNSDAGHVSDQQAHVTNSERNETTDELSNVSELQAITANHGNRLQHPLHELSQQTTTNQLSAICQLFDAAQSCFYLFIILVRTSSFSIESECWACQLDEQQSRTAFVMQPNG